VKILWVKPGKLLPLDSGGKLRTYNILRHLSALHDVTFFSYYSGTTDQNYEGEIARHLPGTIPVAMGAKSTTGYRRYVDYVLRLPEAAPYAVTQFACSRVQRMITEWVHKECFDVAICDFLASSLNFPLNLAIPTVLFQHNVESVLWRRRAKFEKKILHRWIAKVESAKMSAFEPAQVKRFHHVFAVSEDDRHAMSTMVDPQRITVIPTGVDVGTYRYDPDVRAKDALVVFTGSMDWAPNIDAVEYFCEQIWPRVLRQIPNARFRIVGRSPDKRVRALACTSVEVTGSVPSVLDHLKDATVVVVPLRAGSGTRIKIYEGMAMGKAIVSTTIGAEGLEVRHGHDLILADEPESFAKNVVMLVKNERARQAIEARAAETAQRHDWSYVTKSLVNALYALLAQEATWKLVGETLTAGA